MKPFSLLLGVLISVALACASAAPVVEPSLAGDTDARLYRLGIAGLIPRNYPHPSADDWLALYESLPETGELLGVYTNWTDSPVTTGEIPEVITTVFALAPQYEFTPLTALGFYRDAPGGGLEPTLSWADTTERLRFKQVAVAITRDYQPRYLALGGEVNRYYEFDPDGFTQFVAVYAETYDAVKAESPGTLVFPIFQLEMTRGGGYLMGDNRARGPQWELLDRFGDRLDLAAFTTYPFLDYPSPADVPDDYYTEIASHTSLPLAFTEIGWPSAPLSSQPGSAYGGSEGEQATFVRRFFELTSNTDLALALWSFPFDLGSAYPNVAFASVALRHADGEAKPALSVWREFVEK